MDHVGDQLLHFDPAPLGGSTEVPDGVVVENDMEDVFRLAAAPFLGSHRPSSAVLLCLIVVNALSSPRHYDSDDVTCHLFLREWRSPAQECHPSITNN